MVYLHTTNNYKKHYQQKYHLFMTRRLTTYIVINHYYLEKLIFLLESDLTGSIDPLE